MQRARLPKDVEALQTSGPLFFAGRRADVPHLPPRDGELHFAADFESALQLAHTIIGER